MIVHPGIGSLAYLNYQVIIIKPIHMVYCKVQELSLLLLRFLSCLSASIFN